MSLSEQLKSLWDPTVGLKEQLAKPANDPESPETLLKRLHMQLRRRLQTPYLGSAKGLIKGHGLDLMNLREYQPGDDIRKIDWNVLARTGTPHVKEYREEKQVPVWFFIDATASMYFGQTQSKLAFARDLMALLGLLVLKEDHRLGLVLWQGHRHPVVIRPQPHLTQLQHLVSQVNGVLDQDPGPETGFPMLPALFANRCLIVMLSDFDFLDRYPEALNLLKRTVHKHEVMTMMLVDPVEEELIYHKGWLPIADPASQNLTWVNTSDRWMIKEYRQSFKKHLAERQAQLRCLCPVMKSTTNEDPVETVVRWVS